MTDAHVADMRTYLRSSISLASVLVLALTGACDDDDTADPFDEDADVAIDDGEARGEEHADHTGDELGADADLVVLAKSGAIMLTIDEGEILMADYVLDVAIDPDVIAYANRMITEHTAHVEATTALLDDFEIGPTDSAVSAALRAEAQAELAVIQSAADPDYEYMRSQVMMHAEAYVIVGALRDLAPFEIAARFFDETQRTIANHRNEAEVILRNW